MKKRKHSSAQAAELHRIAEQRLRERTTQEAHPATEQDTQRLLHELQVHQIELEMQNEELVAARSEIEVGLEKYTDLYDFAPVGYFTLGPDGTIGQVNITGAGLLGIERSKLVHRCLGSFVSPDDSGQWDQYFRSVLQSAERQTCELTLRRPDGATFYARLESIRLDRPAQEAADGDPSPVVRVAMGDISEGKRIEDAQRFLLHCGFQYAGDDFFKSLAGYLAQSLGMDYVCIDRLGGDGLTAQTVAIHFDGKFQDNVEYALKDTPCGNAVGKTTCCFPKGVRRLFPKDRVLQEMRAESYVGTTLWSFDGKPIGLIAVLGRKPLLNPHMAELVLRLVCVRAAGELERRRVEEALRHSEERFRAMVQAVPDLTFEMDARGNNIFGSDSWCSYTGMTQEETAGQGWAAAVHPDDAQATSARWAEAAGAGTIFESKHRLRAADGSYRWFIGRALPTHDAKGNIVRWSGSFTDIDALVQGEQVLRQANAMLEDRVQVRTAELAQRARQLRALASDLTLTEQRERRRMAKVLHDHVQQLLVGAKFRIAILSRLGDDLVKQTAAEVDELLSESLSASRSLTAELSPPILHEGGLGPGLEWLARWMADKHGLFIDLSLEEGIPPLLEDVKVLLFESVRELLFNVVKHAQVRSVIVNARRVEGPSLQITVSDSGQGFDVAALKRAGELGTGFGLFSIRERLDLIGGKMEVDSSPSNGSRFVLTAPLGQAAVIEPPPLAVKPAAVAKPAVQVSSPKLRAPIRVLLADDHVVMRQGLARLLGEESDIEIAGEAADGLAAIELAARLLPAVILMDMSMPLLNGVEATRVIHNGYPDIRIIGLSMFEEAEFAQAMRNAGAVNYLTKSGPASDLIAAIRSCVGAQADPPAKKQRTTRSARRARRVGSRPGQS